MIYYVTGPDHSGKTTLAQKIVELKKANYIHCDYNKDWDLEEYHEKIFTIALSLSEYEQDVVLDRWCLDAWAYRKYNEGNSYDPITLWNAIIKNYDNKIKLIYCHSAGEFNSDEREEMFNSEQIADVEKEFDKMFEDIPCFNYDYRTDGLNMEEYINSVTNSECSTEMKYWNRKNDVKDFDYNSLPKIIAVDFDGCLASNAFPDINKAVPDMELFEKLRELKSRYKLILWTCRTDDALEDAINFCKYHGLEFDAINDNIKEVKDALNGGPKKVYADWYLDDKSIVPFQIKQFKNNFNDYFKNN